MWPSRELASTISNGASIALIASLAVGVIATGLVVWMGNVKEKYLSKDLSEANERVAALGVQSQTLELDLERERTARLQLEQKYGPRVLNPEERQRLIAALRANNVTHVDILRVDDMEAAISAESVRDAMQAAGVTVSIGSLGTIIPPRYGVALFDPVGQLGPFAGAFRLIAPQIQFQNVPRRGTPGQPPAAAANVATLMIYLKPFPQ